VKQVVDPQIDLQVLDFSRPERKIYKRLEDHAKRRLIQMDAEGKAMSNYTSILAMLMKWVFETLSGIAILAC
jgi:hypothetical protein